MYVYMFCCVFLMISAFYRSVYYTTIIERNREIIKIRLYQVG